MKNRWLNIRESAVSLLRISAILIVLLLLSRMGIQVFTAIDNGDPWYSIVTSIFRGFAIVAFYGSTVFALSWIVSLIGKQPEENVRGGWLDNKESAVSLLKTLAVSIVLLYLPVAGFGAFTSVDNGDPWYNILGGILWSFTEAAYYGGAIFALSWIVSLIGKQPEENVKIKWLDNKESAVSLLKILAVLIVLLSLPQAVIQGYYWFDHGWSWDYAVHSILYFPFMGIFQGCIIFALSWVISLIGQRSEDETPDENII